VGGRGKRGSPGPGGESKRGGGRRKNRRQGENKHIFLYGTRRLVKINILIALPGGERRARKKGRKERAKGGSITQL